MLNHFWIHPKKRTLSIRGYNALFRIAEAQAKLQLKNEVDADIATQTMESVKLMMVQYDQTIQTIKNPRDTTFDAFLGILEDTQGPIEIKELCKMACKRDVRIESYLLGKFCANTVKLWRSSAEPLPDYNPLFVSHIYNDLKSLCIYYILTCDHRHKYPFITHCVLL